jgi:hypothetical protein
MPENEYFYFFELRCTRKKTGIFKSLEKNRVKKSYFVFYEQIVIILFVCVLNSYAVDPFVARPGRCERGKRQKASWKREKERKKKRKRERRGDLTST